MLSGVLRPLFTITFGFVTTVASYSWKAHFGALQHIFHQIRASNPGNRANTSLGHRPSTELMFMLVSRSSWTSLVSSYMAKYRH